MTQRQKFSVQDRDRSFVFHGELLGHASSDDGVRQRWTEMTIYRTNGGNYIIAGAGQTRVKKGDIIHDENSNRRVAVKDETPRAWVHVCESAEGAIRSLYLYDSDQIRYITKIAQQALEQAILVDDALKQAFSVEEVA